MHSAYVHTTSNDDLTANFHPWSGLNDQLFDTM